MQEYLQKAKAARLVLSQTSGKMRNDVLFAMATALRGEGALILDANRKDMLYAQEKSLSTAMLDRLLLNEARIEKMAQSIETIAGLTDPLGRILDGWTLPNGLQIQKVTIPIGVIGVIYESRPNVTSDTAALCLKSGNVVVLKGGKEAAHSNYVIADILRGVLHNFELPEEIISMLPDNTREGVLKLVTMDEYVDLIIPRGGPSLIKSVCEHATVPVVKHDKGVCHVFIDADADEEMALSVAINAKVQRPAVCNAVECILVDKSIAKQFLPKLQTAFSAHETVLKGCADTRAIIDVDEAKEADFYVEYGDNIVNIKIVDGISEAIEHIAHYGSAHSDSIITRNYAHAEYFLNAVDSACVYVNASTRFTDGGEFGFGAEVGISTNKLHARGPMGVNDLTTYKYKILGNGQIRA